MRDSGIRAFYGIREERQERLQLAGELLAGGVPAEGRPTDGLPAH